LRFLLDVVIAARRLGLLDSLMSNGFAGFKAWPNLATRFKALSGAEKSREQAGQRKRRNHDCAPYAAACGGNV